MVRYARGELAAVATVAFKDLSGASVTVVWMGFMETRAIRHAQVSVLVMFVTGKEIV